MNHLNTGVRNRRPQRGATLTEYAVVMALLVTVCVGVVRLLSQESGDMLIDTGSEIGERRYIRDEISDMSPPSAPDWVPNQP